MRYVVLDTETTGLEVREGHRIIEVGCVEMLGRQVTNRHFHKYINPMRKVDEGALAVHGLSDEFLSDKPKFAAIADEFINFIKDSTLIIHNASFDLGFLDMELDKLGKGKVADHVEGVIDSLMMAREMFPGKRNNLDALCDRLGVNNGHRTLHGALLDSEILGEVYLAMTRGQDSLTMDLGNSPTGQQVVTGQVDIQGLVQYVLTEEELAAHAAYLDDLDKESKGNCVWRQLSSTPTE